MQHSDLNLAPLKCCARHQMYPLDPPSYATGANDIHHMPKSRPD